MSDTTPTGVPIIYCRDCGLYHPANRRHCVACGKPSLFINPAGHCLKCEKEDQS